jgi:multicomponent Na+:H+ antiporter subunit C
MLEHIEAALQRPNFIAFVVLFLWGFFIMVAHPNLVKKLIGMYLVQTSVIFLLVTISAKQDAEVKATVPILQGIDAVPSATHQIDPAVYVNPLPHVLTLTAIVVQVATLGVSLALVTAIYRKYGSLDEDEILKRIE